MKDAPRVAMLFQQIWRRFKRGEQKITLRAPNYFPFVAASSLRTFAIVPAEKSLRFLLFWRRLGLVE